MGAWGRLHGGSARGSLLAECKEPSREAGFDPLQGGDQAGASDRVPPVSPSRWLGVFYFGCLASRAAAALAFLASLAAFSAATFSARAAVSARAAARAAKEAAFMRERP